jgi:hypothetical protein
MTRASWPGDGVGLARRVDEACDRFERACKQGRRPRLEDYLGESTGPERDELLRELVPLDAYYRARRGEALPAGDYQARFPELEPAWLAGVLARPACCPTPPAATTDFLDGRPGEGAEVSPAGQRFGDYELLGEIARGGMGVVYRARQVSLGRVVALKRILAGRLASPAEVRRFQTEAENAAHLEHPHIVPVYEVGEHDGQHYFTMQLIAGGSLAEHLPRLRADVRAGVRLLATVARAVQHAHQCGILHRDLKPSNILIDADGQPHVTDFGLARPVAGGGSALSGEIVGTPGYMAPEQAAGRKGLSTAVDVWGLGVVLYELLSGERPFRGETPLETVLAVLQREPARPRLHNPKIDRDLETIALKCLEKDPARRYAGAGELADDLDRWLAHKPIRARRCGALERSWKWARRRPAAAALVALLTLGLGLGAAWAVQRRQQQEEARLQRTVHDAALIAELTQEFEQLYATEVVERVKPLGVEVSHDYTTREGTIPLPPTLIMDLAGRMSARNAGAIKLYSDLPFPWRRRRAALDAFEQEALGRFRQGQERAFYRVEDWQGRRALRYATASIMRATCVNCHNRHEGSPKKDWQEGDVRGVLEIILPVE